MSSINYSPKSYVSTLVCSYVVRKLINPSNMGFVPGRKFSNQTVTSLVASGMFLRRAQISWNPIDSGYQ